MSQMPNMPGMRHDASSKPAAKDTMEASGTSVNPASSPMNMAHFTAPNWRFMVHGMAFLSGIQQTGPRGADKFISVNWIMGEAAHNLAGGIFSIGAMLSLDPADGDRSPLSGAYANWRDRLRQANRGRPASPMIWSWTWACIIRIHLARRRPGSSTRLR